MAIHEIAVDIPKTTVLNKELTIVVRSNGRRFGTLTFSKGTIDWRPTSGKTRRRSSRDRFADVMESARRKSRSARRA
jgi:hypothetical protein